MSRSAGLAAMIAIIAANPALSQDQTPLTAEQVAESAQEAYGPPPPEPTCAPQTGDEIVVCAREQDNSQFRVKSSSELNPESDEALDDGLPRAPDVAGPGIFKGKPTFTFGAPPPPALIIDVSALPQAPEGSDADKIAKGEMPAR